MIMIDRFDIRWVGRCQYGDVDKIWGWFLYTDASNDKHQGPSLVRRPAYAYAFWGSVGKSISLKTHLYHMHTLAGIVKKKKDRHYVEITPEDLLNAWENIGDAINERFMFHILASST
jgi:hypothetical protein